MPDPSLRWSATKALVGNEDGAHKTVADCFQALNDVGRSIPAQGSTYRNREAMQTKDYKDLDEVPEPIAKATAAVARNAAHLAGVLTCAAIRPLPVKFVSFYR